MSIDDASCRIKFEHLVNDLFICTRDRVFAGDVDGNLLRYENVNVKEAFVVSYRFAIPSRLLRVQSQITHKLRNVFHFSDAHIGV